MSDGVAKLGSQASRVMVSDSGRLAIAELKAVVSMVDMASDIVMCMRYRDRGEHFFFYATLVCVLLHLSFTSLLVLVAQRVRRESKKEEDHFDIPSNNVPPPHLQHKPLGFQIREQLFVWSCVKPGVDAYRVSKGSSQEVGELVEQRFLQSARKIIELALECIPMNCIQMLALLMKGADASYIPVLSLALSLFTSAFISADISFSWDWAPKNRASAPEFYGFLPSRIGPLVLSLTLMLATGIFNLAIRTFFCIILYMKSGIALMYGILAVEMAAYMLLKSAREDMWYWVPIYGCAGMSKSVVARVLAKVVADWTACAQLRHPNEVGGAYFSFTIFVNILIGMASALWGATFDANISHDAAVLVMSILCFGLALSYTCFLLSIKSEYRHTFYDTQTSKSFARSRFQDSLTDKTKFQVFTSNEHLWREEIGPEVKAWLNSKLAGWLRNKPKWFDDHSKSIIPDWIVDDYSLLMKLRNKRVVELRSKRRQSTFGIVISDGN